MVIATDKSLQFLQLKINDLAQKVSQYDQIALYEPCFDTALFPLTRLETANKGYQAYFDEIKGNMHKLHQLIDLSTKIEHDHLAAITYLAEKIVNQMTALSRELATQQTRTKNRTSTALTLVEQHAKYLSYLRRLTVSKLALEEKQQQHDTEINRDNVTQISQRIYRCQQAIAEVEEKIERN